MREEGALISRKVRLLNDLPFHLNESGEAIVLEDDIITYLCKNDLTLFMEYYVGATYMNQQRIEETYALHTLIKHSVMVYEWLQLRDEPCSLNEVTLKFQLMHVAKLMSKISETNVSSPAEYLEKLIISDRY